jgi:hypothetical protein
METFDAAVEAVYWLLVVLAVSCCEVLAETLKASLLQ